MRTIPFVHWIANAAACFTGPHGAVTEHAQQAGCSRQCAYDHARKVLAAVEARHGGGPTRDELIPQDEALRRENAQLWDWLSQTIEFPPAKQQQFAVTALAMGLSLNQILALLAILLGARATPSRSTVHRWGQAAATAAGRVLRPLDRSCRALILVGCLDEIFFHRRAVLVGVEPHSLVWFVGKKADDRRGPTWFAELEPWSSLRGSSATRAPGCKRASPGSESTAAGARPIPSRWRRAWMSSTPSGKPAAPSGDRQNLIYLQIRRSWLDRDVVLR